MSIDMFDKEHALRTNGLYVIMISTSVMRHFSPEPAQSLA